MIGCHPGMLFRRRGGCWWSAFPFPGDDNREGGCSAGAWCPTNANLRRRIPYRQVVCKKTRWRRTRGKGSPRQSKALQKGDGGQVNLTYPFIYMESIAFSGFSADLLIPYSWENPLSSVYYRRFPLMPVFIAAGIEPFLRCLAEAVRRRSSLLTLCQSSTTRGCSRDAIVKLVRNNIP